MGEDIASCNDTVAAALQPGCNSPHIDECRYTDLSSVYESEKNRSGPGGLRSPDLRFRRPAARPSGRRLSLRHLRAITRHHPNRAASIAIIQQI